MEIFYKNNMPDLSVDWEVTRGKTAIREDFSGAEVMAFLRCEPDERSEGNTYPLSVQIVDNKLKCDIPTGLGIGVYSIKLIWVKDSTGSQTIDEMLACNKRQMSEVFNLFGISGSQYADTNPNGNITFHIRSSAATYGYDGLSAYERAVMLKKTTKSEAEWVDAWGSIPYERGYGVASAQMKGTSCYASGDASYAGGTSCVTSGNNSFSHGYGVSTRNTAETAFGSWNYSHTGGERKDCTLFSLGNGNETNIGPHNALEVMQDGSIYMYLGGNHINLQEYLAAIDATLSVTNVIIERLEAVESSVFGAEAPEAIPPVEKREAEADGHGSELPIGGDSGYYYGDQPMGNFDPLPDTK